MTEKKPNLLVIVVDCLRQDHCPTVGQGESLASWRSLCSRGTSFTQMISTASTTPVCFASLLSGQYSFVHGIRTIRGPAIAKGIPTLATILKDNGYVTNAYVTGPLLEVLGLDDGFDNYEHRHRKQYIYSHWGDELIDRFASGGGGSGGANAKAGDKPWFSLLHLFELHRPRQHKAAVDKRDIEGKYKAAWHELDERIGQLLEVVSDDTIVVVTADHGEALRYRADRYWLGRLHRKLRRMLNRPRRFVDWKHHGFFVFEELVRIPCAIQGPGISNGMVIGNQVQQIDLMPTILELLGYEPLRPIHGRSLVPLMQGKQLPDTPAYVESGWDDADRYWRGLRREDWKYARRVGCDGKVKNSRILFDLRNDPGEASNVIVKHSDVASEMDAELEELLQKGAWTGGTELSREEQDTLSRQLDALGYM